MNNLVNQNSILTDIVLIDIINFSKLHSSQQLEIITFLTKSYKKMIHKILHNSHLQIEEMILGFVPTGDGFFCILHPRLKGYGSILGMSFNHFSEQIAQRYPYYQGIRIAVHTGDIYSFEDIAGNGNFIGKGLNDCARYLEFKSYSISTVVVSDTAYEYFKFFLHANHYYSELLNKMEFKHSEFHSFVDKHAQEKKCCLVWLRKAGIINLPKISFT